MIERLLDGETGPRRDVVLLNAARRAADRRSRVEPATKASSAAAESLDSGRARAALDALREVCRR